MSVPLHMKGGGEGLPFTFLSPFPSRPPQTAGWRGPPQAAREKGDSKRNHGKREANGEAGAASCGKSDESRGFPAQQRQDPQPGG